MSAANYPDTMSTTEAATSPAQQSPSRSRLGLCIAWLVPFVLGAAGGVLLLLLLDQVVLGGRADLIDGIGMASGVTTILIFIGLRELWRRQRRREAEAADESGVRSSGDAAAKV